ncbi:hypothetical protein H2203_004833 [Taxawa tesnikishii (nom. ined.)]|nr:hypothetical protein H2203_004833 [Dothideales sp. JES 119]
MVDELFQETYDKLLDNTEDEIVRVMEPLSEGVGEVVESGGVELSGNDGLALIEYERVKSELDDELSEADPVDVLASDVERLLENGTAGGVEGTYGEGVLKGVVRDEFHIPAVCDSQPGDLKRNGTGSGSVFAPQKPSVVSTPMSTACLNSISAATGRR